MTDNGKSFDGVHLVGSMLAKDADDAMEIVSKRLGPWVKYVSDGAVDPEQRWLFSEGSLYFGSPDFDEVPAGGFLPTTKVRLKDGIDPTDAQLGELRYARFAEESYAKFAAMKEKGAFRPDARFLVCIPTPRTSLSVLVAPESIAALQSVHVAQIKGAVDEILDRLPHSELAFQWDAPAETRGWAGLGNLVATEDKDEMLEGLVMLGSWLPAEVDLGYHFCFGDRLARIDSTFGGVQEDQKISLTGIDSHERMNPELTVDAGMESLAEEAAALLQGTKRPINYLHLPTGPAMTEPMSEAYMPLSSLNGAEADLFLGLLDFDHGLDSTRASVEAAQAALDRFGISPECGLGRIDQRECEAALDILATIAEEMST